MSPVLCEGCSTGLEAQLYGRRDDCRYAKISAGDRIREGTAQTISGKTRRVAACRQTAANTRMVFRWQRSAETLLR